MIYDNYNEEDKKDEKDETLNDDLIKKKNRRFVYILSSFVVVILIVLGIYSVSKYIVGDISKKTVIKNNVKKVKKKKSAETKNAVVPPNKQVGDGNSAAFIDLNQAEKPLRMDVDLEKQKVNVLDAKNRLVNSFVCSSGMDGYDTPKGQYTIKERGYSFYSKKYQEGAYYWVQFMGNYLFHSVPFDKNQNLEPAEASKLGNKASHGCVRLAITDAKWIYDNIPKGTLVNIK
ncbi:L,D-transpeptidase [Clostridium felsineum]|uniref:L,D-transpeptidase YciB n=1 Tax=Clostridium felsineum TaxID=36839 RepID=A0A1S8MBV2_9CLOT|nr:L,D-transpeptidase [Clostridium felsineum]URZ07631.1 Putative L,D-transpeptidase YciB [Clostridium felsineum]URZ12662.1 Putative L,D-transpeptidase YciB [Clostridium felsineum]